LQRGQQMMIDRAREDAKHGVEDLRRRNAEAAPELALEALLLEVTAELLAAAVHNGDAMPGLDLPGDLRRKRAPPCIGVDQRAADFDE